MAEQDDTNQSDFEKVQGFIKEQVQQYYEELSSRQPEKQVQQQVPPDQQDSARKQAGDFVRSLIGEEINHAQFTAADAKDEVRFYRKNPDALDYESEIEETFQAAAKAGRPTTREDLYNWAIGKEQRTQPDKYVERQKARAKQQLDKAESASDFGVGALNKAKNDTTFANFADLSLEEMEKALDGITF